MSNELLQKRMLDAHENENVQVMNFKFHDTGSINADMGTIALVVYGDKKVVGEIEITALLGVPQFGKLYLNGDYSVVNNQNHVELEGTGYFTSYSYGTKAFSQKITLIMDEDWAKGTIPSLGTQEVVVKVP